MTPEDAASQILLMAPFGRDEDFGGSLRATAFAERLEDRGFAVGWLRLPPRAQPNSVKARNLLSLAPNLVSYHNAGGIDIGSEHAIALAAHSYMAPHLDAIPAAVLRVVDFHNLEWRHLLSLARLNTGVRRAHLVVQGALMRRFEARLVGAADLVTFVSAAERAWAAPFRGPSRHLVVPSVLPRADVELTEQILRARHGRASGDLVYIGQLDHHPNAFSLLRFLRETWPVFQRRRPDLRLTIVGSMSPALEREVAAVPGVTPVGFVDDLRPLLTDAPAVVLPIDSTAGTSVRVMLLALAGVPMIGSPGAFRGLGFNGGHVAESPDQWIDGVERAIAGELDVVRVREHAMAVQEDEVPWDCLAHALRAAVNAQPGTARDRTPASGPDRGASTAIESRRDSGPARRPEVAIVAGEVGTVGGMEQVNKQLVLGLLDRGCSVTVFARRCELPTHPRLSWVRVRGVGRPFIFAYLSFFLFGSLAVWRRRRGVLHTTGAIVLNRADVSTVHFLHQGFDVRQRLDGRNLNFVHRAGVKIGAVASGLGERLIYRPGRTRALLTVSNGLAREIRHHLPGASPVTVIPNGVDRERYRPDAAKRNAIRRQLSVDDADLVAVFVGGDWRRKGLQFAVEALEHAQQWHLLVVGSGDTAEYERLVRRFGGESRLHFVGVHRDPTPFYASADAFVFPTGYEAFSLATLEAAATGLPLLVTPVHGAEELVTDDVNGWFIRRDARDIGVKLCRLRDDAALRERMGAAARASTVSFGWSHVIDQHLRFYEGLADSAV